MSLSVFKLYLVIVVPRIEPRALRMLVSYHQAASSLLYFVRQGLARLSRMALNFWSSFLGLLSSWDNRGAPWCPPCFFFIFYVWVCSPLFRLAEVFLVLPFQITRLVSLIFSHICFAYFCFDLQYSFFLTLGFGSSFLKLPWCVKLTCLFEIFFDLGGFLL